MKMNKKKLFTLAVAVCMIAILSFTTLAWFADDDSVTNEFFMATSTEDPDDIFSVDVYEGIDNDGDGVVDDYAAEDDDTDGFDYDDILPGSLLSKRPLAKNTGAYDQFVRINVVVDNYTAWSTVLAQYNLTVEDLWSDTLDTAWARLYDGAVNTTDDTITYTYYFNAAVAPTTATTELFTAVEIPNQLTREDMAELADGSFTIDVIAEAVQTENLGDGVDTAYEAFSVVAPTTTPVIP